MFLLTFLILVHLYSEKENFLQIKTNLFLRQHSFNPLLQKNVNKREEIFFPVLLKDGQLSSLANLAKTSVLKLFAFEVTVEKW